MRGKVEFIEGNFSKSRIFHWSKKGSIAILDQVLFNGVHFLINILLARWLLPAKYGVFAIAFSIFLVSAALHAAILVEPMLVFGAGKYRDNFKKYLGILIEGHFVITLGAAIILTVVALFIGRIYSKDIQVALLALSIATPFILLLWLLRRAFYVSLQPAWSALGGTIYFILLLLSVFFLRLCHWLSPATYFLSMGLCSLLISLFFIYLLHPKCSFTISPDSITMQKDHLRYGRWALGTNVLAWGVNNSYFVILPPWIGLEGVAALRALMNLSTPLIQTNSALSFLLLPILSRNRAESIAKMNKSVKLFLTLFISVAIIYLLGLVFLGGSILRLLYKNKYLQLSGLVPLVALLPLGTAITVILENALRAIEKTDNVFWCYVISSTVAIIGGILLAVVLGVKGVLWGYVISYLVACMMMTLFYSRFINIYKMKLKKVTV